MSRHLLSTSILSFTWFYEYFLHVRTIMAALFMLLVWYNEYVALIAINHPRRITVTSQRARWRLKSLASRLFTQAFVQAQIKENIKAPRHWPLWGEITDDQWFPRTKGQYRGNVSIWWQHHGPPQTGCACGMLWLHGQSTTQLTCGLVFSPQLLKYM